MKSISEVVCPSCKNTTSMRVNRNGFWQRKVLGRFGFYPWKCGSCGIVFLFRRRGQRRHSHHDSPESGSAA
jgi:ribosomal protein L37AE/L43A